MAAWWRCSWPRCGSSCPPTSRSCCCRRPAGDRRTLPIFIGTPEAQRHRRGHAGRRAPRAHDPRPDPRPARRARRHASSGWCITELRRQHLLRRDPPDADGRAHVGLEPPVRRHGPGRPHSARRSSPRRPCSTPRACIFARRGRRRGRRQPRRARRPVPASSSRTSAPRTSRPEPARPRSSVASARWHRDTGAGSPVRRVRTGWLVTSHRRNSGACDFDGGLPHASTTSPKRATAARRSARSSASPTASSTTGPAPTCCARRSPRRRGAAPSAGTPTPTCSSSRSSSGCSTPASRSSRPAGPSSACARAWARTSASANLVLSGDGSVLARTDERAGRPAQGRPGRAEHRAAARRASSDELDAAIHELQRRRAGATPAELGVDAAAGERGLARRATGARRTSRCGSPTTPSGSSPSCSTSTASRGSTSRREFVLEWDRDGSPVQAFRPDFYLPAYDLYIEITTLNQKLVTKKNRKIRRLRELYPEIKVKILYQRDYLNLLVKYGLEEPSQLADAGLDEVEPQPLNFDVDRPTPVVVAADVRPDSPLDAAHRALGAKLVAFGGWDMPLSLPDAAPWPSTGPAATAAVAFDVSHLGTVRVEGADALDRLQARAHQRPRARSAPAGPSTPTCSTTTARCSTTSSCGGSTTSASTSCPTRPTPSGCVARHRRRRRHRRRGPSSPCRARRPGRGCAAVVPEAAAACRASRVADVRVAGRRRAWSPAPATPARTASSCAVPVDAAPARSGTRCSAPASRPPASAPATRCASRPGCPLHGHELGPGITPLQAGLGWVVALGQGRLPGPGRAGGRAGAGRGPPAAGPDRRGPPAAARRATPCWSTASRPARSPAATSRPCSSHGIALAFLPADVEPGAAGRGRRAGPAAAGHGREAARSSRRRS